MAGKGRRRREKNYKAAHGGANVLPPPPKAWAVDALPSKLRQLMALTSEGDVKLSKTAVVEQMQKKKTGETKLRLTDEEKPKEKTNADENKKRAHDQEDGDNVFNEVEEEEGETNYDSSIDKKKKKKRKRNQVNDLRFQETIEKLGIGSKRKERKKKYLEERKKKKKTKGKPEDTQELHRHEKIAFGDVVQAPLKLAAVPKAFKLAQDASKERLRLKAVEAYRERKKWGSRPGIDLPPLITSASEM